MTPQAGETQATEFRRCLSIAPWSEPGMPVELYDAGEHEEVEVEFSISVPLEPSQATKTRLLRCRRCGEEREVTEPYPLVVV